MTSRPRIEQRNPIARRFQFSAGHRLHHHESKCAHLHGHNYVAWVWVGAAKLDALGRVIDFSVVKNVVGKWIEDNWDHAMLLHVDDDEALQAARMVSGQRIYTMATNPTAENMASELLARASTLLTAYGVRVTKVVLHETENCCAEATW